MNPRSFYPNAVAHLSRVAAMALLFDAMGAVAAMRAAEAGPEPLFPGAEPVCGCGDLAALSLPDTTIHSAVLNESDGSCRVTATVTPRGTEEKITVFIGLPTKNWNGRFRGTGRESAGQGQAETCNALNQSYLDLGRCTFRPDPAGTLPRGRSWNRSRRSTPAGCRGPMRRR